MATQQKIIVKKVTVGTPIKTVTAGAFSIFNIAGADTTGRASGDILIYRQSDDRYQTGSLLTGGNLSVTHDSDNDSLTVTTNFDSIGESLLPSIDSAFDLGSPDKKWKDLYLSGTTIHLGNLRIKDEDGTFVVEDSSTGETLLQNTKFLNITGRTNVLNYDSATSTFTFDDSDMARTNVAETFHQGITVDNGATIDTLTFTTLTNTTTDITEGNNLYYTSARADSDAKNAISLIDAGGDGSMSYNSSTGVITYTGPGAVEVRSHFQSGAGIIYSLANGQFNIDSAHIKGMFQAGTGITFDSSNGLISITDTGVIAGAYGSASLVPVVTVNAQGQIDSIGTVSVAGVSNINFDSSNGNFTINTADGGSFTENLIKHADGATMSFGNDDDFTITHNGSHTVLKDGGTGDLYIEGSKIHLSSQNNGNPIFVTTGDNDGVKLFDSSGDLRLYTHNPGIVVSGEVKANTGDFATLNSVTTIDSDTRQTIRHKFQATGNGIAYDSASGAFSLSGTIDSARLPTLTLDNITNNGSITTNDIEVNDLTLKGGDINFFNTSEISITSSSAVTLDTTTVAGVMQSIDYTIIVKNNAANTIHLTKITAVYDETNLFFNEYGTVFSDTELGTFEMVMNGNDAELQFTRSGASTLQAKITKTRIR